MRFYLLYKNHGLYDPVLDDTEDYYIPIESQDLTSTLLEEIEKEKANDKKDSKPPPSPTKDPLSVPIIDDQLKLKANLYDALLKISTAELPQTARFKLPISEEYDPEGKKVTKLQKLYNQNIITVDLKTVVDNMRQDENKVAEKLENEQKALETELKTEKKDEMTKKELRSSDVTDVLILESLKKTALQIVDDSIEKAVTIAKGINEEISCELEKKSEFHTESKINEASKNISKSLNQLKTNKLNFTFDKNENEKEAKRDTPSNKSYERRISVAEEIKKFETLGVLNDLKINSQESKAISENLEKEGFSVAEEIRRFETLESEFDSKSNLEERKLLTKRDIEETIQEGTVRRRTETISKENEKSESIKRQSEITEEIINKRDERSHSSSNMPKTSYKNDVRTSNAKKVEENAYSLGLKTVPHMRKIIYTSSKSDLLLKTFFLQLTKIMVALSKYLMLEQTIISVSQDENKLLKVEKEFDKLRQGCKNKEINDEDFMKQNKDESCYSNTFKVDAEDDDNVSMIDTYIEGEIIKKSKLSGAKIAQIEGQKPAELTDKMDIVISELQHKSGIDESTDKEDFFRSSGRSRSKSKNGIDENCYRNDVQDETQHDHFFDQREKHFDRRKCYETYETKTTSMDIKEMISEKRTTEYRSKKTEEHAPKFEKESKINRDVYRDTSEHNVDFKNYENLMYIAIVEAHVYTNKDAIFEEKMRRLSESKKLVENKMVQKCIELESSQKESIIDTDMQKFTLPETVIIEPVKVTLAVQPIEDSQMKYATSRTEIEQVSKTIAVQNIVKVIEPLIQRETRKICNKQAQAVIEQPIKVLGETVDVSTEEQKMYFKAEVVVKQRSFVSIEEPEPVIEITEIKPESDEVLPIEKLYVNEKKTQPIIEIPLKPVAATSEVIIDETNVEIFDVPKPIHKSPIIQTPIEIPIRSVAETSEVIIAEPNLEVLEAAVPVNKTPSTHPAKEIPVRSVAITSEVIIDEPNIEVYEVSLPVNKTSTTVLEKNALSVAETSIAVAEHRSEEIIAPKFVTDQAKVSVSSSFAVEVSETAVIEKQQDALDIQKIDSKKTEISVESSALPVANITTTLYAEPRDEPLEMPKTINQMATSNIEEFNATEVSFVHLEGPKQKDFMVPKITTEQSNIHIDELKPLISTFVIPDEPREENLLLPEISEKLPKVFIENCPLTVALSLAILLAGPKEGNLEIPSYNTDQLKTLIEIPKLTVAEVLAIFPEGPKDDVFNITKVKSELVNINIQEFISLIIAIVTPEDQYLDLDLSKLDDKYPQISWESNFLTVATSLAILLQGPKDTGFETEKTAIEKPKIEFEKFRVPSSAIIIPEVPPVDNLDFPKIVAKLPQMLIQETKLNIAEVATVDLEEPKDEYFEVVKAANKAAKLTIEELKATETEIIPCEEPLPENLVISEIRKREPQISIERTGLLTAEISSVLSEESAECRLELAKVKSQQAKTSLVESSAAAVFETITVMTAKDETYKVSNKDTKVKIVVEEPKRVEAKIEEVEIQAKFKIPVESDNSINEVYVEYSVELPKEEDEDVYAEFGFKEKKTYADSDIYESVRLMKKHAFQKQSMEASYSLLKELHTQISIAEVEGFQEEFIKSGSISSSSSSASSPLTPLIEEYLFRLKGPSLWSRFRTLEDVFEEASLKLKSKIQTATVQNFDASLTLILQDVAMARIESEIDNIEVIEIDDYEDIRNLNFSSALLAKYHKVSESFTSSKSAETMQTSSVIQSAVSKQSLESKLSANIQKISTSSEINTLTTQQIAAQKAELSAKSLQACKYGHTEKVELQSEGVSREMQANVTSMHQELQSESHQLTAQSSTSQMHSAKSFKATEETSKSVAETVSKQSNMIGREEESEYLKTGLAMKADKKLTVKTDLAEMAKGNTPSPPMPPATPLTDEYIFRLQTNMPEPSSFIPRDCSISPESVEDEIILKCGLIPHIRTTIERILYSPPLVTPPTSPDSTVPIYSKPGVKSGVFKFLS